MKIGLANLAIIWIIIGLVVGLLVCRLLIPCISRWYDNHHVVSTTALLASGSLLSGADDVKIVYSSNYRGSGGRCAVCLEEYKDGERCAAIAACNHKFHSICVLPWLIWHHTCPLCRTIV